MNILVSICCTTYNHSKYIKDALEGFLMQKTDFKFEILIHDDASTDNTQNIIKEYQKRYPDIIKPIYQKTNKYSLGENISHKYLWPNAKGKYISLCEGDDYWINPLKLQKQVDYMQKHPECSMIAHAVSIVGEDNIPTKKVLRYSDSDTICSTNNLIINLGRLTQTSSYLFRRELINNLPSWYLECSVGDYPLVMLMSTRGEIYYINNIMSCYRTGVPGSWTSRLHKGDNILTNKIKEYNNIIMTSKRFDKQTGGKYKGEIILGIEPLEFRVSFLEGKYKDLKNEKFSLYKQRVGLYNLCKFYVKNTLIILYAYYMKFKSYIKSNLEN